MFFVQAHDLLYLCTVFEHVISTLTIAGRSRDTRHDWLSRQIWNRHTLVRTNTSDYQIIFRFGWNTFSLQTAHWNVSFPDFLIGVLRVNLYVQCQHLIDLQWLPQLFVTQAFRNSFFCIFDHGKEDFVQTCVNNCWKLLSFSSISNNTISSNTAPSTLMMLK